MPIYGMSKPSPKTIISEGNSLSFLSMLYNTCNDRFHSPFLKCCSANLGKVHSVISCVHRADCAEGRTLPVNATNLETRVRPIHFWFSSCKAFDKNY